MIKKIIEKFKKKQKYLYDLSFHCCDYLDVSFKELHRAIDDLHYNKFKIISIVEMPYPHREYSRASGSGYRIFFVDTKKKKRSK